MQQNARVDLFRSISGTGPFADGPVRPRMIRPRVARPVSHSMKGPGLRKIQERPVSTWVEHAIDVRRFIFRIGHRLLLYIALGCHLVMVR